jgi:histidinol-phosphate aminotransferase
MFNLQSLIRPNIQALTPYSSAREEFDGEASVFLDANENSLGSPYPVAYNRYPDPYQSAVKEALSQIKQVPPANIFLGNGSDECIDLLYRCFCRPGTDNVIICPPTYGMYEVSASINEVEVRKALLTPQFQLNLDTMANLVDENTRIIWICSPNNPTANSIYFEDIETVLNNFDGLVVVDEAYINFSRQRSAIQLLAEYPNLVILQTLSKAWGLAAIRLGIAFASADIVAILNKVKPPYNINLVTQEIAVQALGKISETNESIQALVTLREELAASLSALPQVVRVFPSDANFLLVKVTDARGIYTNLLSKGIVVRDRSNVPLCEGCLRITVGTREENQALLQALRNFTTN